MAPTPENSIIDLKAWPNKIQRARASLSREFGIGQRGKFADADVCVRIFAPWVCVCVREREREREREKVVVGIVLPWGRCLRCGKNVLRCVLGAESLRG